MKNFKFLLIVLSFLSTLIVSQAKAQQEKVLRFWDDVSYMNGDINRVWLQGAICASDKKEMPYKIIAVNTSTLSYPDFNLSFDQVIDAIAKMPKAVEFNSLYLRDADLTGKNLLRFNNVVVPRMTKLTDIYFGGSEIERDGLRIITNFIIPSLRSKLEILDLEGVGFDDVNSGALAGSLSNASSLRILYVGKNNLGDAGFLRLMNGVSKLNNLELLSLRSIGITGDSFRILRSYLPMMKNLRILDLRGNNLSAVDLAELLKLRMMMPKLLVLDIDQIGKDGNLVTNRLSTNQLVNCSSYSNTIFLTPLK